MAQGPLTRAAAAIAVLALGAVAEAAAPPPTAVLTLADYAVGAGLGCGGAWLLARAPRTACLALATAGAWFLGTLLTAGLLAYRGPLLHLLLAIPAGRLAGRRPRVVAGAGWIAAVLPLAVAAPATAAAAGATAVLALTRTRNVAADERRLLAATSVAAGSLAVIWTLAALHEDAPNALGLANDLAVLAAGGLALSAATGAWARGAASALVVRLGPGNAADRPITAQLARALGDPGLEIRYALPNIGWVDERGRVTPAPNANDAAISRAGAPGGGEVALLHRATAHPRLLVAATAAAALALDAARLEADIRARAVDIRRSRQRLLTAADAERQLLETRLTDGALARLRRVDGILADRHRDAVAPARDELAAVITELVVLARGLYPPALARADLAAALTEIANRSPVPTTLQTHGDLTVLCDDHRAAVWFVCSEALANIARHAQAKTATVTVAIDAQNLQLEIEDDGHGSATATRGLRGLIDRLDALGGRLTIHSPAGGPTIIAAQLPLNSTNTRSHEPPHDTPDGHAPAPVPTARSRGATSRP